VAVTSGDIGAKSLKQGFTLREFEEHLMNTPRGSCVKHAALTNDAFIGTLAAVTVTPHVTPRTDFCRKVDGRSEAARSHGGACGRSESRMKNDTAILGWRNLVATLRAVCYERGFHSIKMDSWTLGIACSHCLDEQGRAESESHGFALGAFALLLFVH
jgi:hypothetical protein